MKKAMPLAVIAALAGCATSGQYGSKITYDEASAFERSLLSQKSTEPETLEKLFTQPVNKKEVCKLPTTQAQLNRPNFRAYWDGECKNGFAFGFGRDIAISDTHHHEEITIHNGSGDGYGKNQPWVGYDYVNNKVGYGVRGDKWPVTSGRNEFFLNDENGFDIGYMTGKTVASGKYFALQTQSFQQTKVYLNVEKSVVYRFTDLSATPMLDSRKPVFTAEIIDPTTKNSGGVAIVRYADGSIQHLKLGGAQPERVVAPPEYTNHLLAKYQEVLNVQAEANASLQKAQQIEREYKFKACNGKSGIEGLDNAIYTKICTWRDQFKESYATASANYQRQLESQRQQATTAEQQRQIQQQIALQQQMLQQQQDQQALNELNQQLQQRNQQIMQGVNNWQAPQVQPFTPPSRNNVICQTMGNITSCR